MVEGPAVGNGGRSVRENQETIQSDLVEVVATMSKHAIIHSKCPSLGESLPEGSCTRFLICNNVREVKVDQETVNKDLEYLQKHAVVAYFAKERQTNSILSMDGNSSKFGWSIGGLGF